MPQRKKRPATGGRPRILKTSPLTPWLVAVAVILALFLIFRLLSFLPS
jgi:hypothetical protein